MVGFENKRENIFQKNYLPAAAQRWISREGCNKIITAFKNKRYKVYKMEGKSTKFVPRTVVECSFFGSVTLYINSDHQTSIRAETAK